VEEGSILLTKNCHNSWWFFFEPRNLGMCMVLAGLEGVWNYVSTAICSNRFKKILQNWRCFFLKKYLLFLEDSKFMVVFYSKLKKIQELAQLLLVFENLVGWEFRRLSWYFVRRLRYMVRFQARHCCSSVHQHFQQSIAHGSFQFFLVLIQNEKYMQAIQHWQSWL